MPARPATQVAGADAFRHDAFQAHAASVRKIAAIRRNHSDCATWLERKAYTDIHIFGLLEAFFQQNSAGLGGGVALPGFCFSENREVLCRRRLRSRR
jgi:hypothetical protein